MSPLAGKLDLTDYLDAFASFFARPKPVALEGDTNLHYRFIKELEAVVFNPPPKVEDTEGARARLAKQGVLKLGEIFEYVKILRYFTYLKGLELEGKVGKWLEEILLPEELTLYLPYFDDKGNLKSDVDERLYGVTRAMEKTKSQIGEKLRRMLGSAKLGPYLVDRQLHLLHDEECLLVRGGFNHVLDAAIAGRSPAGFFYVIPREVENLKRELSSLGNKQAEIIYEYEKSISAALQKKIPFLKFIDKTFDKFDHYQARLLFAKSGNLEFVLPSSEKTVVLKNFRHPALHDPKPVDISLEKKVLMITGVNAGGKTMLLKSILAAVWLARRLLPMRIDPERSVIGRFKGIEAILDDPQNVKNDISTFAGRMAEFSELFGREGLLVGVDEIELGTDSDEAASLFKVILEKLMERETRVVITTHHKRLAALMAGNPEVELAAAIYDEAVQRPTYGFLLGSIGKSYAFETARRYGIPPAVVNEARTVYGEDKEKLNELIERSSKLEMEMAGRKEALEAELEGARDERLRLKTRRMELEDELEKARKKLEGEYRNAIDLAKQAAKGREQREIHQKLNEANKSYKEIQKPESDEPRVYVPGDTVRYLGSVCTVISVKKQEATLDVEGKKVRVAMSQLKPAVKVPEKKKVKLDVSKPATAQVKLDLHGMRGEEAVETLDKFLNDALLTGFSEVLVYHGIGSGRLSRIVKEFLKAHPSVSRYEDAPPNQGGYGATVVYL